MPRFDPPTIRSARNVVSAVALAAAVVFSGSPALAQTFGTPMTHSGFGLGVEDFATGDLNGDGKTDVVAVRSASGATGAVVALGDGAGGFASFTSFGTGARPRSVALADLNSDGKLDAITANYNGHTGSTFSVLYGDGTGALGGEVTYNAQIPFAVETGDLNGDTLADVVLLSGAPCGGASAGTCGLVSVFLNNGSGLTTPAAFTRNFSAPGGYYHSGYADVKVGDIDIDGKSDLALAIGTYDFGGEAQLQIMPGLGTGGFGATKYFRYPVSGFNEFFHTNSIAVADVTGDLAPDVVLGAQRSDFGAPSSVVVLRNDGTGSFPAAGRTEHVLWWLNGNGVHVGNLDNDGDLDIMAVGSEYGFEYLLNDGVGGFSAPVRLTAPGQFAAGVLADLDGSGDGTLDVVLSRYGTNPVIAFLNGPPTPVCEPGSYLANPNDASCTLASPGYYVAAPGADAQIACQAGMFSSTAGSTFCTPAPAGSFVATTGSSSATLCAAGSYSPVTGSVSCTPAPAGSFVASAGATAPTACPAGYGSNAGAMSCFALDNDGDGVNNDVDAYPDSNINPTVSVGTCTSSVFNLVLPGGASFNDLVATAITAASNHGARVSAVSALSNSWKSAGLINGRDHGAIVSCAAKK
jgi:hypothetical protein